MVIIFKEDWSEVPSTFTCRGEKNPPALMDNERKEQIQRPRERDPRDGKEKEWSCNPEESPSSLPYSLLSSHKYAGGFSENVAIDLRIQIANCCWSWSHF